MAFWKAVLASMTAITHAGIEGGVPIGTIEHEFTGGRAARDEFDHHEFSECAFGSLSCTALLAYYLSKNHFGVA